MKGKRVQTLELESKDLFYNLIDLQGENGDEVELEIAFDFVGNKVYLHVNGQTIVRIGRIPKLTITDRRK